MLKFTDLYWNLPWATTLHCTNRMTIDDPSAKFKQITMKRVQI